MIQLRVFNRDLFPLTQGDSGTYQVCICDMHSIPPLNIQSGTIQFIGTDAQTKTLTLTRENNTLGNIGILNLTMDENTSQFLPSGTPAMQLNLVLQGNITKKAICSPFSVTAKLI